MRVPKPSTKSVDPASVEAGALVVVLEPGEKPPHAGHPAIGPHVEAFERAVESGKSTAHWFCTMDSTAKCRSRHLLVESAGLGPWAPGREGTKAASARAVAGCRKHGIASLAFLLPGEDPTGRAVELLEGAVLGDWTDTRFRSSGQREALRLQFIAPKGEERRVKAALARAATILEGVLLARELVNAPNNLLTPDALARAARRVAKDGGLKATVLDEKKIQERGLNLLWNVGRGCEHPPRVAILEHRPRKPATKAHVVLLGKGVTFDTGGYCIKGRDVMHKMNCDMGGAAAVVGAMQAIAALKLPVRVTAIIGAAHNAIDGASFTPGSILESKSGRTVYIENTDAEGRLILADLLALAGEMKPDVIWDFATLTGAAANALGPAFAALFTDDIEQNQILMAAGEASGDLLWPLPLWPEYEPSLAHPLADVNNMSSMGQKAGATSAANFLRGFVPDGVQWAHMDIAGTAFDVNLRYFGAGATGFGVRLIVEALRRMAGKD